MWLRRLMLILFLFVLPIQVFANYEKGMQAYDSEDYQTAYQEFKESAETGDANSQFMLGTLYYFGYGLEKNESEAIAWFRKSDAQGNTQATEMLNFIKICNEIKAKANNLESIVIEKIKNEAAKGNKEAQYNLGGMYYYGLGLEKDYAEAFKWYQKAAKKGHPEAQQALGYMYETGEGITQNYQEAIKWYRKSAAQKNVSAQCNLGLIYEEGNGVPQNYKEAFK